jgi:hypothetical protein
MQHRDILPVCVLLLLVFLPWQNLVSLVVGVCSYAVHEHDWERCMVGGDVDLWLLMEKPKGVLARH